MNEDIQTDLNGRQVNHDENEVELMDYLMVTWKWRNLIFAGTLAFALVAAIMSFVISKNQPEIYRSKIVLQPGVSTIDSNGNKVYIDSAENIKALIEHDLKYRVLDHIKSSNNTNLSTSLDFQVEIPKGSNTINVSLVSALAEEDTTKLNYLIKTLLTEFANKVKYIQKGIDEEIKLKKVEQANLKTEEIKIKLEYEKVLKMKKDDLVDIKLEEQRFKKDINDISVRLSELEQKVKFINDSNELLIKQRNIMIKNSSQNATLPAILSSNTIQQNLAIENSYHSQIQRYHLLKGDAESNLIKAPKKIAFALREIKELEKRKNNIQAISIYQPDLYKTQRKVEEIVWEIEDLEKEKQNIQSIQVLQSPVTTKLSKNNKTKRNIAISSVVALFVMLFLAFFLEYLYKYKSKLNNKKL